MFCIGSNGINKGNSKLGKQTRNPPTSVKCATEAFLKINTFLLL